MTTDADQINRDTVEQYARINREMADTLQKAASAANLDAMTRFEPRRVLIAGLSAGAAIFAAGGGLVALLLKFHW